MNLVVTVIKTHGAVGVTVGIRIHPILTRCSGTCKKFGSLFGGKGGGRSNSSLSAPGGGIGIGIIVVLLLVLWSLTGFYKIEEAERGVVLRFGAHVDTTQKGLHWHLPVPIESVEKVNISERKQVPFKATVLTQDENIIDLQGDFTVPGSRCYPVSFQR